MYEFDSVSVSSFEAGSLTATLTEKSADGWDVVAIVTAGSDVVAYLKRATASPVDSSDEPTVADIAAEAAGASTASDLLAAQTDTAAAPADDGGTGWGSSAASAAPAAQGWNNDSSSTPAVTSEPAASSGWGSSSTDATGASSAGSWSGSSQQAAATQPAATPQVPAGWYADPAGRFELRYWDGGAWTEHVSRAGQQYTDPPVA